MNTPKSNVDHAEIPIWNSEDWLYEDFEVGKRAHAQSVENYSSEGESMMFNALVLDMHPYVADEVSPRRKVFLESAWWLAPWCSAWVWG